MVGAMSGTSDAAAMVGYTVPLKTRCSSNRQYYSKKWVEVSMSSVAAQKYPQEPFVWGGRVRLPLSPNT